jgi:hypothetical protein
MFAKAPPNSCTPLLLLHSLCERCADLEPFAVKKPQDIPVHFFTASEYNPSPRNQNKNGPEGPFLKFKSMLNESQTDPERSPDLAQLQ